MLFDSIGAYVIVWLRLARSIPSESAKPAAVGRRTLSGRERSSNQSFPIGCFGLAVEPLFFFPQFGWRFPHGNLPRLNRSTAGTAKARAIF
jgi:hypothetical protein